MLIEPINAAVTSVARVNVNSGASSPAMRRSGASDGASVPRTDNPGGVEDAMRALNEAAEPFAISLQFNRDDETGTIVIKMIDRRTGEVVQQIPHEAMLHLSAVLGKLQGQIFDRKA